MPTNPFRNPFTNPDSSGPFRDALRYASKQGVFVTVSRTQSGFVESPVPVGTRFIWNVLHHQDGIVRMVKGRYKRLLAPHGHPEPQVPAGDDPSEYQPTSVWMVWLDATPDTPAGIREFSLTGIIALNAFSSLFTMLSYKKEIQTGMLPVLEIHESDAVENNYGTFGAPVCEVVGFVDYDDDVFGSPICRPPAPMLSSSAPVPRIAANDEANDAGSGSRSNGGGSSADTSVLPPAKPTEVPKPANDPLMRFKPSGTDRKPY